MKLSATVAAIEFEDDEVRIAVVKTGGKFPSVLELHAARANYSDAEQRLEALTATTQDLVGRVKARPSAWVLCVGCQHGIVRNLTVPTRVRRRGASAIQFELEPYLAFPIDELVVDFATIRDVNGESEVLAVGMRHGLLGQYVDILEEAGVEVEGINVDASGFTSLWQAGKRGNAGLCAALHVRDTGSVLVVMHQKAIAYFRHVPITAADMRENPRKAARQAQNSMRAFLANWEEEGQGKFEELTVTGVDLFAEERVAFEEDLNVPVVYEDLLRNLKGKGLTNRDAVPPPPVATEEPLWTGPEPALGEEPSAPALPPETAPPPQEPEQAPQGEATIPMPSPEMAPLWQKPAQTPEEEDAAPALSPEMVPPFAGGNRANYWEAVIGVAAAAAGGSPSFNFRKDVLAQKNVLGGIVRHVGFSAALTVLALAAYSVYCYLDYRGNVAEMDQIGEQVWEMYVEAFPETPRAKEGRDPADRGGGITMADMEETAVSLETGDDAAILALIARPTMLAVLEEISSKLPSSMMEITDMSVRMRGSEGGIQRVTISGVVVNSDQFNAAWENFRQSEILEVSGELVRSSKGGKETVTITATL